VQLYESAFEFACAGLFFYLHRAQRMKGIHFPLYMTLYMVFRFCVEFIRIEPRIAFDLSVYQLMSILFVPLFASLVFRRVRDA
jgi:prolipoprotein diacylglyceryltransferase